MNWNRRYGVTKKLEKLGRRKRESVIQDIELPLEQAEAFIEFFHRDVGISPIWMCPTRIRNPDVRFDFFPFAAETVWTNFGFWDTIKTSHPDGHYNRVIEAKVRELGGTKSLYSDSYYSESEFWELFDRRKYDALKAKFDPQGAFLNLYDKCVLKE